MQKTETERKTGYLLSCYGKGNIRCRDAVSHQAGLSAFGHHRGLPHTDQSAGVSTGELMHPSMRTYRRHTPNVAFLVLSSVVSVAAFSSRILIGIISTVLSRNSMAAQRTPILESVTRITSLTPLHIIRVSRREKHAKNCIVVLAKKKKSDGGTIKDQSKT
jgi:hypothetical protein